jgi:hypothetical protein
VITQSELKELFSYCEHSGMFIRKTNTGRHGRWKSGDIAGSKNAQGYWQINIGGHVYLAHRLAWLYVYGYFPVGIDHINSVRRDNRLHNLREATQSQNMQNEKHSRRNNVSGFLGVFLRKDRGTYVAKIRIEGEQVTLGTFKTPEDAHAAYLKAKRENHSFCTI